MEFFSNESHGVGVGEDVEHEPKSGDGTTAEHGEGSSHLHLGCFVGSKAVALVYIVHLWYHWEGLEMATRFEVLPECINDATSGAESFASCQEGKRAV